MPRIFIYKLYRTPERQGGRPHDGNVAGRTEKMLHGYRSVWLVLSPNSTIANTARIREQNGFTHYAETVHNQHGEVIDVALMQDIMAAIASSQSHKRHGNEYYMVFNDAGDAIDHIITPDYRHEAENIHNLNKAHLDGLLSLICDTNYGMLSAIQTLAFASSIDDSRQAIVSEWVTKARASNADFCAIVEKDLFADAVITGLNSTCALTNFISEHHEGEIFHIPGIDGGDLLTFKGHIDNLLTPTLTLLDTINSVQVRLIVGARIRATMELRSGTTWLTPARLVEVAQLHIDGGGYAPAEWPGDTAS